MAQPYVGEIRMFAGTFAPDGWEFCQGQLLLIAQHETLYQLIGTMYGGDGQTNFALPDMRGRIPIHRGGGIPITTAAGVEQVTLTNQQLPVHNHPMLAAQVRGDTTTPGGNLPAQSFNVVPYINDTPVASFAAGAIIPVGGSQPHTNFQPYLCVQFIISKLGIFPSPT